MKWKFCCYLFITALVGCQGDSSSESYESSSEEHAVQCPDGMVKSICAGCWSRCPVEGEVCAKKDCEVGCACEEDGYVWHNRACIPASQCPLIPKEGEICPEGMEWNFCSHCNDYCTTPGEKCVHSCRIGCVCKREDQRMYFRECRSKYGCVQEFPLVKSCPRGTKWADCAKCEQFCAPARDCAHKCNPGCVCKNQKLAVHNGRCMAHKHCPKPLHQ